MTITETANIFRRGIADKNEQLIHEPNFVLDVNDKYYRGNNADNFAG